MKTNRSSAHAGCTSQSRSSCAFCVTETVRLLTIETSLQYSGY